mmetsp:Transcript_16886/g.51214  ORF Transcript_16886/g.51214 Transcript_16886/m.51214 type:complete len:89 (-) Transcript_16886:52-318(-)
MLLEQAEEEAMAAVVASGPASAARTLRTHPVEAVVEEEDVPSDEDSEESTAADTDSEGSYEVEVPPPRSAADLARSLEMCVVVVPRWE